MITLWTRHNQLRIHSLKDSEAPSIELLRRWDTALQKQAWTRQEEIEDELARRDAMVNEYLKANEIKEVDE